MRTTIKKDLQITNTFSRTEAIGTYGRTWNGRTKQVTKHQVEDNDNVRVSAVCKSNPTPCRGVPDERQVLPFVFLEECYRAHKVTDSLYMNWRVVKESFCILRCQAKQTRPPLRALVVFGGLQCQG